MILVLLRYNVGMSNPIDREGAPNPDYTQTEYITVPSGMQPVPIEDNDFAQLGSNTQSDEWKAYQKQLACALRDA